MENGGFVEATHHEFDRRRLENAGESMDSLAAIGAARRVQNPDIDEPDEGSASYDMINEAFTLKFNLPVTPKSDTDVKLLINFFTGVGCARQFFACILLSTHSRHRTM